jgi:hypothetical protein
LSTVTEQELSAVAVAPRVTPADIQAAIASAHCFTAAEGTLGCNAMRAISDERVGDIKWDTARPLALLTICVLVLHNGFTVTGTSACASPENFDANIGRRLARADAERQLWPLLGYALRDRLHAQALYGERVDAA